MKNNNETEFTAIVQDLQTTSYLWDASGFSLEDEYVFKLFAYSVDTTLYNEIETATSFPLPTNEILLVPDFSIIPNPVSSILQIIWKKEHVFEIERCQLVNTLGQSISVPNVFNNGQMVEIDISQLPIGRYELLIWLKIEAFPLHKAFIIER